MSTGILEAMHRGIDQSIPCHGRRHRRSEAKDADLHNVLQQNISRREFRLSLGILVHINSYTLEHAMTMTQPSARHAVTRVGY